MSEIQLETPPMIEQTLDFRLNMIHHHAECVEIADFSSAEQWEKRKQTLRNRILLAAGLYPPWKRAALNVYKTAVQCFDGFTVENLFFESLQGVCVAANLYIPQHETGKKLPAILCPHGHWAGGRLERSALVDIPVRMANYARNGFIGLSFDMCGYGESFQFIAGKEIYHSDFGKHAAKYGVSLFGLQLINAMAALDVLWEYDGTDRALIGASGASGGATQCIFLAAIDQRIAAVMPVNMLSEQFQGGCDCENAPFLRIGTSNMEYAAMIAPRPMCITGTSGDWTANVREKVYPQILQIYNLYGAREKLSCFDDHAPHNYNKTAREQSYRFFSKVLKGVDCEIKETPFVCNTDSLKALKPSDRGQYLSGERLIDGLIDQRKREADAFVCKLSRAEEKALKGVLTELVHIKQAEAGVFRREKESKMKGFSVESGVVDFGRYKLRCINLIGAGSGDLLFFDEDGLATLMADPASLHVLSERFRNIVIPDIFLMGPSNQSKKRLQKPRGTFQYYERAFFDAYNDTDDIIRIQDMISMAAIKNRTFYHAAAARGRIAALLRLACNFMRKELHVFLGEKNQSYKNLKINNILGLGDTKMSDKLIEMDQRDVIFDVWSAEGLTRWLEK